MQVPTTRTKLASGLSLVALLMNTSALAAPATSDELDGAKDGPAAASGLAAPSSGAPVVVVPGVAQSKSVELLLQLQDQPQQATAESRGAAGSLKRAPVAASGPAGNTGAARPGPEDTTPLSMLKSALLRDAAPRPADAGNSSSMQPLAAERQGLGSRPSGSVSRGDSGPGILSHPLVQYIRENRMLVLGVCAAVLAGIWLTATFSLRRNR